MNELLQQLNDEQLMSVITTDVPVRIIAGAGSGKTRVITTKVAYLIDKENIKPYKILCVTFTNKASKEMLNRISKITNNISKPHVTTFHSFGARVLREEYMHCGLDQKFAVIDTNLQKQILRKIFKELDYDTNKDKNISIAINKISGWKNSFTSFNEAEEYSHNGMEKHYAIVYRKYKEYLDKNNFVDFDDLLLKVHELFNKNFDVRQKWINRYDYILVDEFQDTNIIQYDIIKWINGDKNSLTVVGDPDQTIYTWRGANVNLILDFDNKYPNSKTINLNRNYRSTRTILNLANDFIENNSNRYKKDIISDKISDKKPMLKNLATKNAEAKFVVSKIKDLVSKGNQYKDFFILYRMNSWSLEFEKELSNASIPYKLVGGFRFSDRKVIQDITAMLKVIALKDQIAFERIIKLVPKVGMVTAQKIIDLSILEDTSIFDLFLENYPMIEKISKRLDFFVEWLQKGVEMYQANANVLEITKYLVDKIDYKNLFDNTKAEDKEDIEYMNTYFDQMNSFDENFEKSEYSGMNKLDIFLQEANLDGGEIIDNLSNHVTLLTVHAAKGLENKVVFITGLSKGIFPSKMSSFKKEQIEEERRALYVAITRAEDELYLTYVNGEYSYNAGETLSASMFINELNSDYLENDSTPVYLNMPFIKNEPETPNFQKIAESNDIKIGDKIEHLLYGIGMITRIVGKSMLVVFENNGKSVKTIPMNNSAWKKVV